MAASAMARTTPPRHGTRLYNYIYARLMDPFAEGGDQDPLQFRANFQNMLKTRRWFRDSASQVARNTLGNIDKARARLDSGDLVPIIIMYTLRSDDRGSLWNNHQILLYDYETLGSDHYEFKAYDPNHENEVTEVEVSNAGDAGALTIEQSPAHGVGSDTQDDVYGFFVIDARPMNPPFGNDRTRRQGLRPADAGGVTMGGRAFVEKEEGIGDPIAGAVITFTSEKGAVSRIARTDDDGTYDLTVSEGTYNVAAHKDGYVTQTTTTVVEEGGNTTLNLFLDRIDPREVVPRLPGQGPTGQPDLQRPTETQQTIQEGIENLRNLGDGGGE